MLEMVPKLSDHGHMSFQFQKCDAAIWISQSSRGFPRCAKPGICGPLIIFARGCGPLEAPKNQTAMIRWLHCREDVRWVRRKERVYPSLYEGLFGRSRIRIGNSVFEFQCLSPGQLLNILFLQPSNAAINMSRHFSTHLWLLLLLDNGISQCQRLRFLTRDGPLPVVVQHFSRN